jgi:type IV secretion system protein VirB1
MPRARASGPAHRSGSDGVAVLCSESRLMSEPLTVAAFIGHLTACIALHPVIAEVPAERAVATAQTESRLHPFALGDNTARRSYFFGTLEEATTKARELLSMGHRIDAGLMQITDRNWSAYGLTVETVFTPRANICAGARILGEAFGIERRAHCRYNTGRAACANGYPERVDAAARIAVDPIRSNGEPTPQSWAQAVTPASPNPDADAPPDWDVWAQAAHASRPRLITVPRKSAAASDAAGIITLSEPPRSVE